MMRYQDREAQRRLYLKRRHKRQRRIMVCLTVLAAAVLSLSLVGMTYSTPKLAWVTPPPQFYKPQMVSQALPAAEPLKPLPMKEENAALRQKLQTILSKYPENLKPHLFYFNLQDYSYVSINGEDAVPAASVIKLPILLEYFRQLDKGRMTPYTHIMYEDFEQAEGSGGLQYKLPGQPLLAKDVAAMMIQTSDNTCTNMLIYQMGGADELNRAFESLGLKRTHIGNWLPDLRGTNVISMQDMSTVLFNIIQTDVLSWESRMAAMDILKGTKNRRLMPALLPPKTVVAHKTGDIGTSLGNAGIVILPNGQKYILSIQVERPFNHYGAAEMIRTVSKAIYDDVNAHNPTTLVTASSPR